MKFEINKNIIYDLGLSVKHGNKGNIVVFYDVDNEASQYIIELYRHDFKISKEGFLKESKLEIKKLQFLECDKLVLKNSVKVINDEPTFFENNLVSNGVSTRVKDYYNYYTFYNINKYSFDNIKPICSIVIDRNKYYANIDFLPSGSYFLILKIENRNGEILKASMPYHFFI